MTTTFRLIAGLTLLLGLAACAGSSVECTSSKACIETTKPVGNTFEGTVEQLVEVRIPGQAPSHIVRSSDGIGGRLVESVVPVVVGGGINAATALAVANKGKCNTQAGADGTNYGCGNIIVAGGTAVAGSSSSSTSTSTTNTTVGTGRGSGCATCQALD